jgi:cysteine-rich repeat protein
MDQEGISAVHLRPGATLEDAGYGQDGLGMLAEAAAAARYDTHANRDGHQVTPDTGGFPRAHLNFHTPADTRANLNNTNNNDDCKNDCSYNSCGDGIVEIGVEECDDGNTNNYDSCRNDCTYPYCGDQVVDAGEDCDDGNDLDGDGCDEVLAGYAALNGDGSVRWVFEAEKDRRNGHIVGSEEPCVCRIGVVVLIGGINDQLARGGK